MRGLAALMVFFSHVGMMTWWPRPEASDPTTIEFALWHLGAPSVDLFFVLSGYVLAGSLEGVRATPRMVTSFCARRWVRLVPIAWASVLVALAVKQWIVPMRHLPLAGMAGMAEPLGWRDAIGLATFVAPLPETERINPPLWSLMMEMYASLLIPLTIWGLRAQGRSFLLPAFLSPVILWYVTDRLEFMTLPLFVLGVVLRTYVPPARAQAAVPALLAGLLLLFSRHFLGEMGFWHRYVSGIGAAIVIMAVHAGAARDVLTSRPVAWLGRTSYAFYAVHFPILLAGTILLAARGVQTNLAALCTLPFALAAAHALRKSVELPSIAASRRIALTDAGTTP